MVDAVQRTALTRISVAPKDAAPENVRVVKRYANRKLYDTRASRYVTLQQIAEFVRDGEDVRIIDNRSKEDLTNVTLAQIIYEEEKLGEGASKSSSIVSLRSFIQQSRERIITTFRENPVGKLVQRGDEEPEDEEPPEKVAEESQRSRRWVRLDDIQRVIDDRVRAIAGVAAGTVHQLQGEVGRLQARIDELEQTLVKIRDREAEEAEKAAANPPPIEDVAPKSSGAQKNGAKPSRASRRKSSGRKKSETNE